MSYEKVNKALDEALRRYPDLKRQEFLTKVVNCSTPTARPKPRTKSTHVTVVSENSIDAAQNLGERTTGSKLKACDKVIVLNLACSDSPGGDWKRGGLGQEEDLFLRTTLMLSLDESYGVSPLSYPLPRDWVVLSRQVLVCFDSDFKRLQPEEEYFIDVMSMTAVKRPKLKDGKYTDSKEKALMKAKIEAIFHLAAGMGKTKLVLGALGCDEHCNPPDQVCEMFCDAIDKYGGHFEDILFAIPPTKTDLVFRTFRDRMQMRFPQVF